jgi:hypothetical protein
LEMWRTGCAAGDKRVVALASLIRTPSLCHDGRSKRREGSLPSAATAKI